MKLKASKVVLQNVCKRAKEIATKGVKSDFDLGNRIKLIAKPDQNVEVSTSNGHLDFRTIFEADKDGYEPGEVIFDATIGARILSALGGKDADPKNLVELSLTDKGSLKFNDVANPKIREARIPSIHSCRTADIKKPNSPKISHQFDGDLFIKGIQTVIPYPSPEGYKIEYQMVCLHFLTGQMRFVCGSGARFGVYRISEKSLSVDSSDGLKMLLPVDQANIITSVVSGSKSVFISYKDKQNCYISTDDGIEMYLRGIPDVKYIAYENHAFRTDEARLIVDLDAREYRMGVDLVDAVKNEEIIKEGLFHTATFNVESDNFQFTVNERKYSCDFNSGVNVYRLKPDATVPFRSKYAAEFLLDSAKVVKDGHIRFYCIREDTSIIAVPVTLDDTKKDSNGVPLAKGLLPENEAPDNGEFRMFFAHAKEI